MNAVNLLLIAFLTFLAPDRGPMPGKEQLPCDPVTGLVRMVKGRILVSSIKKGMTSKEVDRILGTCSGWSMSLGHSSTDWEGYGVYVSFTPPIAEIAGEESRVISVQWRVPLDVAASFSLGRLGHNR
jgi:hypothetical protein